MDRAGMRVMHPLVLVEEHHCTPALPRATEIAKAGPALVKNFL